MTDEPESVDLRFLAEQGKRILAELSEVRAERAAMRDDLNEVRAEQHALAGLLGKVSDAVTEVAKVQERHSELLAAMHEHDQLTGGRLNAIEARLARIEKHVGLVKA